MAGVAGSGAAVLVRYAISRHARERARERYGISISAEAGAEIARRCAERRGAALLSRWGNSERYLVRLGEVIVVAAYNRESGVVVSILPQGAAVSRECRKRRREGIRRRRQSKKV